MKYILLFVQILFFFPLFAQRKSTNLNLPPVKLKDYVFDPTPNDLNKVGYIFGIDILGRYIPIMNLDVNTLEGNVVVETKSRTKDVAFGSLLKFVNKPKDSLSANFAFNSFNKVTTTFNLENAKINRTYLISIDTALRAHLGTLKRLIIQYHLDSSGLYIINETIKTSKFSYEFSKSQKGNTDLNLAFKSYVVTNDSIKWNNSNGGKLSFDLKTPVNVFYKITKLDILNSPDGIVIRIGKEVKDVNELNTIMVALPSEIFLSPDDYRYKFRNPNEYMKGK